MFCQQLNWDAYRFSFLQSPFVLQNYIYSAANETGNFPQFSRKFQFVNNITQISIIDIEKFITRQFV